jgi:hypothetical protein
MSFFIFGMDLCKEGFEPSRVLNKNVKYT